MEINPQIWQQNQNAIIRLVTILQRCRHNGRHKEKLGSKNQIQKIFIVEPQPHKWWTERNIWGPKIGLKLKSNQNKVE